VKLDKCGRAPKRGELTEIRMDGDGFVLTSKGGEVLARCAGPRLLLRYARECEAQEVKHCYDCKALEDDNGT
jgi:hypothetical protein